ncbi:hypothetical protein VTN49DRAFT_4434 [Thermomyces lanuginosus]|uniref:uncharacterized protein n=1 Tax=Thermomyces lanuginosus TaxID=5541 RepID=UPI003742DC3D
MLLQFTKNVTCDDGFVLPRNGERGCLEMGVLWPLRATREKPGMTLCCIANGARPSNTSFGLWVRGPGKRGAYMLAYT